MDGWMEGRRGGLKVKESITDQNITTVKNKGCLPLKDSKQGTNLHYSKKTKRSKAQTCSERRCTTTARTTPQRTPRHTACTLRLSYSSQKDTRRKHLDHHFPHLRSRVLMIQGIGSFFAAVLGELHYEVKGSKSYLRNPAWLYSSKVFQSALKLRQS